MSASIARLINTLPVPVFGSARTAALFTVAKAKTLPRMFGWAVPLGVGALWFVWPAVDDGWKMEMGLMADPEAAMKAAEAAKEAAPTKVELSPEAEQKIEDAYKAQDGYVETDEDKVANKMFAKAAETGDYTYLEEKWEAFIEKATRPGEDDDDEDEDDDDDDDEDEDDEDEDDE